MDINQRRFQRIELDTDVCLFSGTEMWKTRMVDISLKGILLKKPDNWNGKPGDYFRVEIIFPNKLRFSMAITVSSVRGDNIGAHCEKIDFESFRMLRRIVELNLGDTELLNRELEQLEENSPPE